jgi:hypothetical protein
VLGAPVGDGPLDERSEHGAVGDRAQVEGEVFGPGLDLSLDFDQRRHR